MKAGGRLLAVGISWLGLFSPRRARRARRNGQEVDLKGTSGWTVSARRLPQPERGPRLRLVGESTASGPVESPDRRRRTGWWGIHRLRAGRIPGPAPADRLVGDPPPQRRSNPRTSAGAPAGGESTASAPVEARPAKQSSTAERCHRPDLAHPPESPKPRGKKEMIRSPECPARVPPARPQRSPRSPR
jgi:hypothetical protein